MRWHQAGSQGTYDGLDNLFVDEQSVRGIGKII